MITRTITPLAGSVIRALLFVCLVFSVSLSGRASSLRDDTGTIVDIAIGNPDFSILVEAVVKAELVDALRSPGPFTVFAPTNAAFEMLFSQLGVSGVADLTKEQLTPILLYHVLGAKVLSTDLAPGQTVATLQEGLVTVLKKDGKVTINGIEVIAADVEASNGVIHVINRVLLPDDIVAVASANPAFSILVEAVVKAELVDALRSAGPFTVFAPTNDAFVFLLNQLGLTSLDDLTKEQLTPILLYHVLSGAVLSTDLSDGLQSPTLLADNGITIFLRNNQARVNQVNILATDVAATNGVIHVVERVLLPPGKVTSFTLVNAQTAEDLLTIEPGSVINLGEVNAEQVSIRVNVFPEMVGSVIINLSGQPVRTENHLPYSLLGDSFRQLPLTYTPWNPETGEYTLTATPYAVSFGRGTRGTPLTVSFSVINGAGSGRLAVYPNPSSDRVNINFANGGNGEVEISLYDSYGKVFLRTKKRMEGGRSEIDLSTIPSGIYLMNAVSGNRTEIIRISKQ